ncbi:MAG: protein kinase, partial [archaeon]|nr:protein kinase [archaeon]
MKCSLNSCQKQIVSAKYAFKCPKCPFNYCCQSCLTYHIASAHEPISPFLIKGVFALTTPEWGIAYDLYNFDMNTREKIGRGSFGEIFSVKHIPSGKYYAIKIINKKQVNESGADLSIIKSEIAVHIRIDHPFIIKLHSYEEDIDNFYMIMDYAPHNTLFRLIKNNKMLTESSAFKYFIQICSAIQFLHRNGFVHRDIKPENILLDENYDVKLCDFGWCVDVTSSTRSTFCGTFEYMAPEIINEQDYDFSIDLWSLGVLLFEMTHGYSPFVGEKAKGRDMHSIFNNINKGNFSIKEDLSEECKNLITKLLKIDSSERMKINEIFEDPWVKMHEATCAKGFERFKAIENALLKEEEKINKRKKVTKAIKGIEDEEDLNINLRGGND